MKKTGKLLSVLLALVMVLSLMPMTALAADGSEAKIGDKPYDTLAEAIDAANAGDTVTLLKDAKVGPDYILATKNITLDLAGHNVTSANTIYVYSGATIKDGSFEASTKGVNPIFANGGEVNLSNLKINANASAVYIANGKVTIDKDCVFALADTAEEPVVTVIGANKDASVEVHISGKLDASATEACAALQGNGTDKCEPTLYVEDGAELISNNGTGIYHPQPGTLNISGGSITGATAVEVRAGNVNITGGRLKSTAKKFEEKANGNGSTISGAVLAVSQHTTNLPIDVTIEGGTLECTNQLYSLYEKDLQDTKADNIKMFVTGGEFGGNVYSQNVKKFISGGLFYYRPDAAYLADECSAPSAHEKDNNGKDIWYDVICPLADYTAINEAKAAARAKMDERIYTLDSVNNLRSIVDSVPDNLNMYQQDKAAEYAKAIYDAIDALVPWADCTALNAALAKAEGLDKTLYKDFTKVDAAVKAVKEGLDITKQASVDAMAKAINDAIDALVLKDADYTAVNEAVKKANALDKTLYKDFTKVDAAVKAVKKGLDITKQAEVDAMSKAINDALDALELLPTKVVGGETAVKAPDVKKDTPKETVNAMNEASNALKAVDAVQEKGLEKTVEVAKQADGSYKVDTGADKPLTVAKADITKAVAEKGLTGTDFAVVAKPFLQVQVTSAKTKAAADGKVKTSELTFDIKPLMNVEVVDKSGKSASIKENQPISVKDKTVTITLTLPEDFVIPEGCKVQIEHTKEDGTKYVYDAKVDGNKITFENPNGFSTFTVQTVADTPKTGDANQMILWSVLMIGAACGAAYVVMSSRKRRA